MKNRMWTFLCFSSFNFFKTIACNKFKNETEFNKISPIHIVRCTILYLLHSWIILYNNQLSYCLCMKKFPRNKIMKLYHPQKVIYICATWEHLLIIQAKNIPQCCGGSSYQVHIFWGGSQKFQKSINWVYVTILTLRSLIPGEALIKG